jgi:hypothetical protein
MQTSKEASATPATPSFADVDTTYAKFMKRIAMGKFRLPPDDADELVHDVFATYFGSKTELRSIKDVT